MNQSTNATVESARRAFPQAASSSAGSRRQRWAAFLEADASPGFLFLIRHGMPDAPPRPPLWPELRNQRVEWMWQDYQAHAERSAWLDDDLVPALNMQTGTEIFAEALGCAVHRPDDNMPFALPAIHSASDIERVRVPELSASSLAYLFEMADELQRRAGPEAAFRMVDIQSPLDIAALVLEKSAFFMALLEAPDAVMELADKAYQLLTAFLDEWFSRYGKGFVAHFPDYYMPWGVTLSEDEIGSVGSEMFATCFRPYLVKLAERYGGLGVHCCAQARHHWAALRTIPGLRVLNICQPREVAAEAYRHFADACVQMHGSLADSPPESWPGPYPSEARVVLEVYVAGDSREAERTAAAWRQLQCNSR